MIVLSADQVRGWDDFTMEKEAISSNDLMERAALACIEWMDNNGLIQQERFYIFCGKGNNGGDGLAIARMLYEKGRLVDVFILEFGHLGTHDFQLNLQLLHALPVNIHFIQSGTPLPDIPSDAIIIDALLGTGINRRAEGILADLILWINKSGNPVISIDMPSGMFTDIPTLPQTCISANLTLSFQCFKPALVMAENAAFFGNVIILDIGLHPEYLLQIRPFFEMVDNSLAANIVSPRPAYAHKGIFGHALLLAGARGKMGAAIFAAKACLRAGAGLLTCGVPENGLLPVQTTIPEAMALTFGTDVLSGNIPSLERYKTISIGPGCGSAPETVEFFYSVLCSFNRPMVIDADAINMLAENKKWLDILPPFSILTPHPREFERLVGKMNNDFERVAKATEMAKQFQMIIILKGHRTFVAMPGGRSWFNTSGNASMSKGGSGDVLTGMLTGLLSRGYSPEQAALLGVYIHGIAGELASEKWGMESVLASDIIDEIGNAFLSL